ncbi:MAG: hypothetical protein N2C14_14720, partial [Planctomycetales bacterium]
IAEAVLDLWKYGAQSDTYAALEQFRSDAYAVWGQVQASVLIVGDTLTFNALPFLHEQRINRVRAAGLEGTWTETIVEVGSVAALAYATGGGSAFAGAGLRSFGVYAARMGLQSVAEANMEYTLTRKLGGDEALEGVTPLATGSSSDAKDDQPTESNPVTEPQ